MPFHSKFELVRTDERFEEKRDNIISVVEVLRFADFMKRVKEVRETSAPEAVTDLNIDDFSTFFFRQRYNEATQTCIPELKPSCICRHVLNPDDDCALCPNPSCGQYMHVECLRHNADRKCFDCKTEFPLKDFYKRTKLQAEALEREDSKQEGADMQVDDAEEGAIENKTKRMRLNSEEYVPAKRTCFPSLSDDKTANTLEAFIKQTKGRFEHQAISQNMTHVLKSRKQTKDNFAFSLLLGAEEAREKAEFERILEAMQWKDLSVEPDIEKLFEYALKVATGIESGMFIKFDHNIGKEYSAKYRKLSSALRNDENYDLRLAVLTGQLEAVKLFELSDHQLAPKRIQEL